MAATAIELEVGQRKVRISNPEKVYFADVGVTKLDVAQHFISCGEGVMRALRDRPTTLERWPAGYFEGARLSTRQDNRGDAFYQKRAPANAPDWVQTARIAFPSGRYADEVAPTELAVVVWAANLGTLTYHPWPVRRFDVDHPDELRIDLDPQPGTDFAHAAKAAGEAKALLDELGLGGFPKTSGGRGIHILVRVEPRWDFVEVRYAAIAFARELERRMPALVTSAWWKEERGAKVFIDYNQNARDRTVASAYSIRPRPGAPVSAPLTWDELPAVDPRDFTVRTMAARFAERGDLLDGIDNVSYSLEQLLEIFERDRRDRDLGDMPYPPEYPKMPGEPMRVQPSRARRPDLDE